LQHKPKKNIPNIQRPHPANRPTQFNTTGNLDLFPDNNSARNGLSILYFTMSFVQKKNMHIVSAPNILYFGTPVILIRTTNEDGSYNLAPMSSAFWLGWRCVIGLAASSKTTQNIQRTGECVLNLASVNNAAAVNKLARTTGSDPVPLGKQQKGYYYNRDKFDHAGLTPINADIVNAPMAKECDVQLEAKLIHTRSLAEEDEAMQNKIMVMELQIIRVHLEESILMHDDANKVDPNKWKPLIMSFQKLYSIGDEVHYSILAEIPEDLYRTPDIEKADTFHFVK
jgi:flavin reductase (DIM6/NTAB) family NADH-FMN oxidoreductase RutF